MSIKSKVVLCVLGVVGFRVAGYVAYKYVNHVKESKKKLEEEQEYEQMNEILNDMLYKIDTVTD